MRTVLCLGLFFTIFSMPLNGQYIPVSFWNSNPKFCDGELGGVDTTFGSNGFLQIDYNSVDNLSQYSPHVFDLDSQGRIYLSGWEGSGAYDNPVIARVLPNGFIDTSFGTSGFRTYDLGSGSNGKAIQIYNDEIYVSLNGAGGNRIMKLDLAGDFVTGFGTNGVATNPNPTTGDAIFISGTGGLYQNGQAPGNTWNDISSTKFDRTTGALDSGFATNGYLLTDIPGDEFGYNMEFVGGDQQMYITSETYNSGNWRFSVTKWDAATGASISSFANNGHLLIMTNGVRARYLNQDPSGNIYVQGGASGNLVIAKADPSGNLDLSWGTNGIATIPVADSAGAKGMVFIEDSMFAFVEATVSSVKQLALLKLLSDGTLDPSFGTSGIQLHPWPGGINSNPMTFHIDQYNRALVGFDLTSPTDGDWGLARFCLDSDSNSEPLGISVADVTMNEGGNMVFEIRASRGVPTNLTVDYATSDGTGVAGTHYTATSGTATILAGQRSTYVSVPVADLATCDGNRTFQLTLSNNSSGSLVDMQAQGMILDTDTPSITFNDGADVVEGNDAIASVSFDIACSVDVTFDVTTTDGTATAGQDYNAQTNQQHTMTSGNTSVNIPVTTIDDVLDEYDDQDLTLTLTNPSLGTIVDGTATLRIDDNDPEPTLTVNTAFLIEEGNTESAVVTIDAVSEKDVTFNYQTTNGTAIGGADMTTITSTAGTITAGNTTLGITLDALDDALVCEPDRVYTLNLSAITNATNGNDTTSVTVRDADWPVLTIADDSQTEGTGQTFNVSLSFACPSDPMSFDWFTAAGTAIPGEDFTFSSGTVTIPATQTTSTINVATINDTLQELAIETFAIASSNYSFVKLGPSSVGQGNILDDESAGETTVQVVTRRYQTCALSSLGNVKCWGDLLGLGYDGANWGDQAGEMGNNLPIVDFGLNPDNGNIPHTVRSYSGTGNWGCAVMEDSRIRCWGGPQYFGHFTGSDIVESYYSGDINGETVSDLNRDEPGTVDQLGITRLTVNKISVSANNACFLESGGNIKCWGWNNEGVPMQTNSSQLNGDAFGFIDLGTSDGSTPHTVKDFWNVGNDRRAYCAHLNDDRLKCWGDGGGGMLGSEGTGNLGDSILEIGDALPYVNLGTGRTVKQLSRACAVLDNDQVKCWGLNNYGRLGTGNTTDLGDGSGEMGNALPYIALGTHDMLGSVPHWAKKVVSNEDRACAILDDDRLKCWGRNDYGQLGLGDTNHRGDSANEMGDNLPYVDLGAGRTASDVYVGFQHTLVIRDDGSLIGFGRNDYGALGIGTTSHVGDGPGEMGNSLTTIDIGGGDTIKSFNVNDSMASCVITNNDELKCWGRDQMGTGRSGYDRSVGDEVGDMGATLANISLPTGRTVKRLFPGRTYSASFTALLDDDSYITWGNYGADGSAVAGDRPGTMGDNLSLQTLPGGTKFLEYYPTGSGGRACSLRSDFNAYCHGGWWGSNNAAIGGNGGVTGGNNGISSAQPVNFGNGRLAVDIAMAGGSACAILSDSTVKCWGNNNSGVIGQGNTQSYGGTPETSGVNLPTVDLGSVSYPIKIDGGQTGFVCALFENGLMKCWGENGSGQLGQGDNNDRGDAAGEMGDNLNFIDVGTGRTVKDFAVGHASVCAIRDDDSLVCWGDGTQGVLGRGDTASIGNDANEMGDNLVAVDLNGNIPVQVSMTHYDSGNGSENHHTCALLSNSDVKCWGGNLQGQLGIEASDNRGDGANEMGVNLPAVNIQW